jgi:hypothetical protein|tara:strand:- start:6379 stop:7053 length:675 start_codon:yes stop_codon:yes gene_type:complete
MKKIFLKYKYKLIMILNIVVIFLLFRGFFNANQKLSEYKNTMQKFDLKEQVYIEKLKENGSKIIEQEQVFLNEKDAIKNNLLKVKKDLKKVKNQIKYITKIEIDSFFIPFDSQNNTDIDSVKLKKTFSLVDEFYNINGYVNKDGVLINKISFHNDMTITIANKKNGIFKKSIPIIQIENSNPYIVNESLKNITIKNNLKWYEKRSNMLLIGFATGIATGIVLTK